MHEEGPHPVVEDALLAAHELHQAQVVLPHHGVARHHDVDALPQQLVQDLQAEGPKDFRRRLHQAR